MKTYPDIRAILKKKEQARRTLAALSFEKKVELVFKLRRRAKFIKSGLVVNDLNKAKNKAQND